MNYLALLIALILLVPAARAQEADSTLAAELFTLERAWAEAEVAGDTLTMRRILSDHLVATTFYGAVMRDPDAAVQGAIDPNLSLRGITQHDLEAHRINGDVAFVTGRVTMDWSYGGVALPDELRYTRIYQRQEGRWRVIAAHVSPVYDPLAESGTTGR